MALVKLEDLSDVIAQELENYRQDVTDSVKNDVKTVAKECKQEIQAKSPILTGDYKKGWRVKKVFESENDIRVVVENKTDYQLTHLLEHGHDVKNEDGKVIGHAPAHPHIGLAAQNASRKLVKKLKVTFENGKI